MRQYKHWANLNEEGKKLYGEIFPNGEVPVLSFVPQTAKLEGVEKPERVFIIYWDELTEEQKEMLLTRFSKRSGVSKEVIKAEIEKTGLPLREKYTAGSGTNHLGLLI